MFWPPRIASQGWQYSLMRPSTLQVRLYFKALVGNAGSAPTRIFTSCRVSKLCARWWATMPMKPGASPHCGMKAVLAPCARLWIARVAATSSVRSK